jgi:hypothetical protein
MSLSSYGPTLDDIEIRSIGVSFSLKMVVISRRPTMLEFFDPLAMSRFLLYKLPAASTLILFDWIRKSKAANFFVVSTAGVQIVLLEENSLNLKKGSNTSSPIINAWYDGVKQFLAVNFLDAPNELKIYDFNKVDEGINFKQPVHQVALKLGEMGGRLPVFNTNSYYERSKKTEESNSSTVIDFINLYKECYLLHIDSERGSLTLHEVGGSGMKTVKILSESRGQLTRSLSLQHSGQPARHPLLVRADHHGHRCAQRLRPEHHLWRPSSPVFHDRRHLLE